MLGTRILPWGVAVACLCSPAIAQLNRPRELILDNRTDQTMVIEAQQIQYAIGDKWKPVSWQWEIPPYKRSRALDEKRSPIRATGLTFRIVEPYVRERHAWNFPGQNGGLYATVMQGDIIPTPGEFFAEQRPGTPTPLQPLPGTARRPGNTPGVPSEFMQRAYQQLRNSEQIREDMHWWLRMNERYPLNVSPREDP